MGKETKEVKLTLYMGKETLDYKNKLQAIGERLLAEGVDVEDKLRGGISASAVVRHLIDKAIEADETK
jgi:hypothetical protein